MSKKFYRYVPYSSTSRRYFWSYSRSSEKEVQKLVDGFIKMYKGFIDPPFPNKKYLKDYELWSNVEIAEIKMEREN